ncbi:unnamed protein product [Danaus chrysippus]|uniref:(African queen) hypothetical protein n=1 Tax=Danaus chrysippus TaxID=151541 RepID=A0A8J2W1P3_9NEOP|nr:unnamed protein product [Danaus chrysippus]
MDYTQAARAHTHTDTHTYVHEHVRVCGRVGTENACADTDALCALFKRNSDLPFRLYSTQDINIRTDKPQVKVNLAPLHPLPGNRPLGLRLRLRRSLAQ